MACAGSLQLSYNLGLCRNQGFEKQFKSARGRVNCHLLRTTNDSCTSFLQQDLFSIDRLRSPYRPIYSVRCRSNAIRCHVSLLPSQVCQLPVIKAASTAFTRSCNTLYSHPLMIKLAPAVCIIIFAVCGLGPLMRKSRNLLLHKNDNSWKKSTTNHVATSYIQPSLLWIGAILICRELDPIVLPTEASQVVKQRVVNFVRSLSTVLAFAYCFSSMIQQAQKYYMETTDSSNTREMSFQFAGKAVYTAVWVASISLFMELLGFSTQRLLTAGGLGTVLLTLAGREIFINFLSGAMIHATRPFVANEWIQTKIEGYEVSGTVEHVGWWSPTIIRGENREAIHIPNHKFTVNVVRNLSQKTHWRIKTHLAISHVDVNKIHNIVADMRKVLAKNPQVEQQRLHRRVFLENVNLENQALTILVSCFVKTSHHEEYLCVKEAILLDLLRVIGHHRARLATPIRTIQKSYYDADLDNIPFADSVHDHGVSAKHPLLLIEPQYKIYGEDKTKSQSRSTNTRVKSDTKVDAKVGATPKSDPKADNTKVEETSDSDSKDHPSEQASTTDRKVGDNKVTKPTSKSTPKTNSKISETSNSVSKGPVPDNITKDKKVQDSQPKSRAILEDNIVLGVALEGSKRTLPIGEDVDAASSVEVKESAAASWNGNASSNSENEKQDGQNPGSRSANSGCSITS